MARHPRYTPIGMPVHILQRGNDRQVCFVSDEDLAMYASLLREASERYGLLVHAWVFMSNHVHLLASPLAEPSVSRVMQLVGAVYARYFNRKYGRTGTRFEGRFKSHVVETGRYFCACQMYIELNPVRARMVNDPAGYVWSSYRCHAFGVRAKMWTPHGQYLNLGVPEVRQRLYRLRFQNQMSQSVIEEIRDSISTGFVLGTERFREQAKLLTGYRQSRGTRGPRPKENRNAKAETS